MEIDNIKTNLKNLLIEITNNEEKISEALFKDLGKSHEESLMTEIGQVTNEIKFMLKNLNKIHKKTRIKTSILNFPAKSYIINEPYGDVLIVSPWNYPFNLSLIPLVGAIACGNSVTLKPSTQSIHTSLILKEIIDKSKIPAKVLIGPNANEIVMNKKFDYIFFTGGLETGRKFYEKAAREMTPITLELGGKSPSIVMEDADIKLAAKRISFGKFLNAGQTCVAVDHVYVHDSILEEFKKEMEAVIKEFFGDDIINSKNLGKIINSTQYNRIIDTLKKDNINIIKDDKERKIAPTVVISDENSALMEREIFAPILPLIKFNDMNDVIDAINKRNPPLALYIFTKNTKKAQDIMRKIPFGGGAINDTINHIVGHLPFGGFHESGIGHYHEKFSINTFSHQKSILEKSLLIDTPFRYPGRTSISLIKKIFGLK